MKQPIIKQFCEPWLADGIGDEYKMWETEEDISNKPHAVNCLPSSIDSSHVFIESATGTGKTSFVLDKLLPYAIENNRSILYVSNRTALLEQVEHELCSRYDSNSINDVTPRRVENKRIAPRKYIHKSPDDKKKNPSKIFKIAKSRSYVGLCNYQSLSSFCMEVSEPFYYIVFDEIHFFLVDALFNPRTGQIYQDMLWRFNNFVFIMMSATIQEIYEGFKNGIDVASKQKISARTGSSVYALIRNPNIWLYQNTFQRQAYNPVLYYDNDILIQKIADSSEQDKWVIFVTSMQKGADLKKQIQERINCSTIFLHSGKKKTALWRNIIEQSSFEVKVLITTQVLDNGVNIDDSAVKHVVLPLCDRTEFIQMLGRKRLSVNEKVNVYVKIPDSKTIRSKLHQINRLNEKIAPFVEPQISEEYMTKLLQRYWMQADVNIIKLFYIDHWRNLRLNLFAYIKINLLGKFYEDLLNNICDSVYFAKMVHGWLNIPYDQNIPLANGFNSANLDNLIQNFLDKPIALEEQGNFYAEFQSHYKSECAKRFQDDPKQYEQALSIRKGKTQRKATINRELALLGLPYEVIKHKNCWLLKEK